MAEPKADSALRKTRDGRTTKAASSPRYIINSNTGQPTILKQCSLIERSADALYTSESTIKGIGDGTFTKRDYQANELIGRFRGAQVYSVELADKKPIMFEIKEGKVHLLNNLTHILWAESVSKSLSSSTTPEAQLLSGVKVEGALKYINCSKNPNVYVQSYINPTSIIQQKPTLGRYTLKPGTNFQESITITLVAQRDLQPNEELLLDYSPESETFDFAKMDNYPTPELDEQTKELLLNAARAVAPESPYLRSGNDWLAHHPQQTAHSTNPDLEEQTEAKGKLPSGFPCNML